MSYETDWLHRQIAYWQDVLARADPNDRATRDHAERELRTYETWLQLLQEDQQPIQNKG